VGGVAGPFRCFSLFIENHLIMQAYP